MIGQKMRIGRLAFIGGLIGIGQHVPPFMFVRKFNRIGGLNLIGLRRVGMLREEIDKLQSAFRIMFDERNGRGVMIEKLRALGEDSPAVRELYEYFNVITGPICKGERSDIAV